MSHDDKIEQLWKKTEEFCSQFKLTHVDPEMKKSVFEDLVSQSSDSRTSYEIQRQKEELRLKYLGEFCMKIHEDPGIKYSKLRTLLSFSASVSMVDEVRKHALSGDFAFGFLRQLESREGRPALRLLLKERGIEILKELNLVTDPARKGRGKGTDLTAFLTSHVLEYYTRSGLDGATESFYDRADITIRASDGTKWAIEINLSGPISREILNVERDILKEECSKVICVPVSFKEKTRNVFVCDENDEKNRAAVLRSCICEKLPDHADKVEIKFLEDFKL